jgi:hypothetical protein
MHAVKHATQDWKILPQHFTETCVYYKSKDYFLSNKYPLIAKIWIAPINHGKLPWGKSHTLDGMSIL